MILVRHRALCALAFVLACSSESSDGVGAPGRSRETARSVVLVSIDTLRADHLGSYGYERPTSPNLDALAQEGARFLRCSSPATWTVPAHCSMFTGLYPRTHGVDGWQKSLSADTGTLAEALDAVGFATAAFVNVNLFNNQRGYERGFDAFELIPELRAPEGSANKVIDRALEWLAEHREERFFLFVHLYDVHSDYIAKEPYLGEFADPAYRGSVTGRTNQLKQVRLRKLGPWGSAEAQRLVDLYDAGVRQLDADIERLLKGVCSDDALLLVTSDHGEEFLEHGDVLHGRTLYQELVGVPLIAVGPGIAPGTVIEENVSLVDLMPTVLGSLGVEIPEGIEGIDLGPSWCAVPLAPNRVVFAEADKWMGMVDGNFRRAVMRGDFKLLRDGLSGRAEVYDLSADPDETHNLAGAVPELVKALSLELERFEAGGRELDDSFELSDEEIEALRELGYF